MSLTGKTLAGSYKDLLQVDNSNSGITAATNKQVKDGRGRKSCFSVSQDKMLIQPQSGTGGSDTTTTLEVKTQGGTSLLSVDTVNEVVKASGNNINTQYAHFGINNAEEDWVANTHHAIPFGMMKTQDSGVPNFGTGTDPATTFTTTGVNQYTAAQISTCLWYLHDPITLDVVKAFQGADTATGHTNRFHLFSYDFTSGSANCLTNGTLLAHSADTANDGYEQPYLTSAWTIDSANVVAGKVILAFFVTEGTTSDYALNLQIKYHIT